MSKRVFLFVMTNLLILATLGLIIRLFNLDLYLARATGYDLYSLGVFCLVWGMGGSLISLSISRWMAKMSLGVKVIDLNQASADERWLVATVNRLAEKAGLEVMPEVGIYASPEVNAFATGPSRNQALVAVSSGILDRMEHSELEAVLGHELTHVANGDMVTMCLLQGVINALVMIVAYILASVINQALRGNRDSRENRGGGFFANYMMVHMLQMVLGIFGMLVVLAYSRRREFRADFGGASLAGKNKMIAALQALQSSRQIRDPQAEKATLAAFKISGGGMSGLFASHPPLEARIAALKEAQVD